MSNDRGFPRGLVVYVLVLLVMGACQIHSCAACHSRGGVYVKATWGWRPYRCVASVPADV